MDSTNSHPTKSPGKRGDSARTPTSTREVLDRERAETLARIAALQRDVSDIMSSAASTTGDDEHDPEGATIGFERAQAMALLAQARDRLNALDAAVARLDAGQYGVCVSCGQSIPTERLAARPEAVVCVTCARCRRART